MVKIKINIAQQELIFSDNRHKLIYPVSTALNGPGQQQDSGQTPLGLHIVRAKIGQGKPINTVFVGRRPTKEIYNRELGEQFPGRDWILTRILWLSGKQVDFNRLGNVDTMRRYIYIHGTPYENELGRAVSHGCIRMANQDVIELFDLTPIGCPVEILNEQRN